MSVSKSSTSTIIIVSFFKIFFIVSALGFFIYLAPIPNLRQTSSINSGDTPSLEPTQPNDLFASIAGSTLVSSTADIAWARAASPHRVELPINAPNILEVILF